MSRNTIRSVVLATLLVVATAGVGVASASENGANRAETNARVSMHAHVSVHADEGGLNVAVSYEGSGSALVVVEGTDANYSDGGRWTVENEREFHLDAPEKPSGIEVTVETPRGEVVRTIEYETVSLGCGDNTESVRLPTRVEYTWTVEAGNETYSGQRSYDVSIPDVECPEVPKVNRSNDHDDGESGESDLEIEEAIADIDESLDEHEERFEQRLVDVFDDAGEASDGDGPDGEVAPNEEDAHEEAHEREDEGHETVRTATRQANDTVHGRYGDAHDAVDPVVRKLLSGALIDGSGAADHAEDDLGNTKNESERDAAVVADAAGGVANRVLDDGEEYAGRARNETGGATEDKEDGDSSDSVSGSATVSVEVSGQVTAGESGAGASGSATVEANATANATYG